jgi:integrase
MLAPSGSCGGGSSSACRGAREGDVHRTTFTGDQQRAIVPSAEDLRDRIALRLLVHYWIRKGALRAAQFKHFDHQRKRLTIFTKGRKVREIPIPHPAFWMDLERHILDAEALPSHYLMCRQRTISRLGVRRFPDKPLGDHGLHDWWYRQRGFP